MLLVCLNRVLVYSLSSQPVKLFSYETGENQKGLVAMSSQTTAAGNCVIAFPGRAPGQIQVVEIPTSASNSSSKPTNPPTSIILAHNSSLSSIAVSPNGQYVASASEKGTLIRVFESKSGQKAFEFRRGMDPAEIYSLHFNATSTRICVASDKGTVHVFQLSDQSVRNSTTANTTDAAASTEEAKNRQSSLSFMAPILPKYFSSEWSFAYFKLPVETKCTCAFTYDEIKEAAAEQDSSAQPVQASNTNTANSVNTPKLKEKIAVIGFDGSLYKYIVDEEKGGECPLETFNWFIKDEIGALGNPTA